MKTNLFYSIVLSFLFTAVYSQTATFEGLGYINEPVFPEPPISVATDASYDGSVVVGASSSLHGNTYVMEAYRWTEEDGLLGLGGLLEGNLFFSFARAISDDGTTIVGYSTSESPNIGAEPFRWTESEDIIGLGDLVPENYDAEACDVSGDGSVVAGRSYTASECFRWEDGEMQRIAEEGTFGEAWGVSADGSVVVGSAGIDGFQQAFRWTEETGMAGLGFPDPEGLGGYSVALKVSGDGTTIVGFQQYNLSDAPYSVVETFRWTEETGRVSLGHLSEVLNS